MIFVFAKFKNLSFLDVRSTILKHLKNTLTDRVAVNHCVVQHLQLQKWMLSCLNIVIFTLLMGCKEVYKN